MEFIVDQDSGEYYFLEMNTCIQVEHPVTELRSGIDLVQAQIRLADGQPLGLAQDDVRLSGHAIECRVNAESPAFEFRPCPGTIVRWSPPTDAGVRVDSHCYPGYTVPPYYDSLLAKLITHGADREEALARMRQALDRFEVTGIDTTIPFLRGLIDDAGYRQGRFSTRWVEEELLSRGTAAAAAAG